MIWAMRLPGKIGSTSAFRFLTPWTMKSHKLTRRSLLALSGSLVAGPALARKPSRAADDSLSAEAILERVTQTYASCKTYQDEGSVRTVFLRDGRKRTQLRPFSTAFVRASQFRYEFRSTFNGIEWDRYLIARDGAATQVWWDVQPGVTTADSLASALAGATGVSGGSAWTIPALVMPDEMGSSSLAHLVDLQRLQDAQLDGIDCFRIQGAKRLDTAVQEEHRQAVLKQTGQDMGIVRNSPYVYWIDRSSFLLRRLDAASEFSNFSTESTTVYKALLDAPVAANQLRFDPPEGK